MRFAQLFLSLVVTATSSFAGKYSTSDVDSYGGACGTKDNFLEAPFCRKGFRCTVTGMANVCVPQSSVGGPCGQALQYPNVCKPGLKCDKSKSTNAPGSGGKCVKGTCGKKGDKCNAIMPCKNGLYCSTAGMSVGKCSDPPNVQCFRALDCPPGYLFHCSAGCQPVCPY
ncbi:hypothetical protein HDU81_001069 [Chytriomyces hyalinus]|nr:hypothetical protein HDU81_001069 [Chytriomyces hyalinus]